jgi:hypothetical protein
MIMAFTFSAPGAQVTLHHRGDPMKFLLWLLLLVLCWPLALLALVLWPLVWLISLPFRLLGIAVGGLFALLRAIVFLPARVLGGRP